VHKLVCFDEAWFLLQGSGSVGHRLVEQLSRWGRAENATPVLITHLIADAEAIDNLIGARFIFGMESETEAEKALRLLRLDADDGELRQRLLSFRRGRCLFRDYEGQVVAMQVDLADPRLVAALDTTPGNPDARSGENGQLADEPQPVEPGARVA
jgi:AAA domain-containing protein